MSITIHQHRARRSRQVRGSRRRAMTRAMDRGLPRSEALAQSYVAGGRLDHHEMRCVNTRSLGARDLARLDRAMTPTSPNPELPDPELEDEIWLNPGDPTNRQAKRARAKVRRRNRKRVRE